MSPRPSVPRRKPFDYRAAYLALGMSPEDVDAMQVRTRKMALRVARGEITPGRARDIVGAGAFLRAVSR